VQSSKDGKNYFLKLDIEEDVIENISKFCLENDIKAASIKAIGVLKNIELGYYDIKKGTYEKHILHEDYELLSFIGNIGINDGIPHPHIHVVLGDKKLSCIGGHLLKAKVGVTCEVFITSFDMDIERLFDEKTKLKLLKPVG
jgi:uncharacterized protein